MRILPFLLFTYFCLCGTTLPAQTSIYPDTLDGFRQQFEDLVALHQTGDHFAFRSAVDALAIPDVNDWIATHFPSNNLDRLQRNYRERFALFERDIIYKVETVESLTDKSIAVIACDPPHAPEKSGPESTVPMPRASINVQCIRYGPLHSPRVSTSARSFVYTEGRFRYAGEIYPFWWEELQHLREPTSGVQGPINRVSPKYPEKARKKGVEGIVQINMRIDKSGVPRDLKVISGDPLLVNAALDAVRQWRFEPSKRDGISIEVETIVQISFALTRKN